MKLSLPTKAFLAAIATIKPIAKPSTTYPILGNVCITADKDTITLLGMDGEKQLSITLPAKVKDKGAITIPIAKLHDSLVKMRAPDCTIESNEKHETTVKAGSAITKLLGLPIDDMIPQVAIGDGEGLMIPALAFNTLMANCLLHASSDQTKALMNSVIILSRGGMLNLQSTDYRHSIICATEIPFEEEGVFIVPRDSVPAMVKLATEGDIELMFGENAMSIKTEGMEFRSKLLDGNVPEFEKAYPTDRPLKITANREELIGIVEYAQVQTDVQSSFIILKCDGKSITATGSGGIAKTESEGFMEMNFDSTKCKKGSAEIEVKLNPTYLRDALKCFSEDEVTLEMVDAITPVVIQEGAIRCAICPMRLN